MVFAAGFGTRMRPLTLDRPKPLIEVAGRTLLDHALELAIPAGAGPVAVNTHYLPRQIEDHLRGRGIAISHEPELLDTAGGLRAALPHLGTAPLFTLNSDMVWSGPNPLRQLGEAWRRGMGALLLLVPGERAAGRKAATGDFDLDPSGRLIRGGPLVYTGAQIIDPAILGALPPGPSSLNAAWDALAAQGRLHGIVHEGGWCDVGHPGGIAIAEAMLAEAGDV
ncbi:nucleotidyltransferase family protein [Profundibacterium mesophilum]|nr:nucleotidyltransferase family protein [Profundibacterium mesophilum]